MVMSKISCFVYTVTINEYHKAYTFNYNVFYYFIYSWTCTKTRDHHHSGINSYFVSQKQELFLTYNSEEVFRKIVEISENITLS